VIEYGKAMRAVDPEIRIAAVGGENQGRYSIISYPNWNRTVLQKAGRYIDLMSVHNAYAPLVLEENESVESVYKAMFAAPLNFARNLDLIGRRMSEYAPGTGSKIGIAVTEWGPAFKFDLNSRWVDHVKTLGAALYSASMLKTMIESPRVEAAHFWMLNDFSALGVLGSRNTDFPPKPEWVPTARYYAFQLFTKHFGEKLIQTRTAGSPVFDSKAVGVVDPVRNAPYLDVVSSLSADRNKLYIIAINKDFENPIDVSFSLRGFSPEPSGAAWTLTGTGVDAHTGTGIIKVPGLRIPRQAEYSRDGRFHKTSDREVTFERSTVTGLGPRFVYTFPARSATSIVLTFKHG
jgi:alpha-N-arabinofuranosidase